MARPRKGSDRDLPEAMLIVFSHRENPRDGALEIEGECYSITYHKLSDMPPERCNKQETISYAMLDGHVLPRMMLVAKKRGEIAQELVEHAPLKGHQDCVLVPRIAWDTLWERVNKAERWARLWKNLAKKFWLGLRRIRHEQWSCPRCGDCEQLGDILDKYTPDTPTKGIGDGE